jgi:hypothetical protein
LQPSGIFNAVPALNPDRAPIHQIFLSLPLQKIHTWIFLTKHFHFCFLIFDFKRNFSCHFL